MATQQAQHSTPSQLTLAHLTLAIFTMRDAVDDYEANYNHSYGLWLTGCPNGTAPSDTQISDMQAVLKHHKQTMGALISQYVAQGGDLGALRL